MEAMRIAMSGGVQAFIGTIKETGDLARVLDGEGKGTYFEPKKHNNLTMKKQWIAFHTQPKGYVTIDEGAERALLGQGSSLLPVGVIDCGGDFHRGDVIEVRRRGRNSVVLGRGVVNYDAWQIKAVQGMITAEVKRRVDVDRYEVIHRDDWVEL
jgi:glutamate 5-kinase